MAKRKATQFIVDENGCFICTNRCKNEKGYSLIRIDGKTKKLHRHIYEQMYGPIAPGLIVRHLCNKPACINPEHLREGTHKENSADAIKAGTNARALNSQKVLEIIKFLPHLNNSKIAEMYGVDPRAISKIRRGESWGHLTGIERV